MREHALERAEAADAGHGHVHHQHVGPVLGVGAHRGLARVDLGEHCRPGAFEQQAKAHAHGGVVVCEQDADSFERLHGHPFDLVTRFSGGGRWVAAAGGRAH